MSENQKSQKGNRSVLENLSLELEKELGSALAQKLSEKHEEDIPADMTKNEAIAKMISGKAVNGDIAAAKYIYDLAKKADSSPKEPFMVELSVVGDEI